MEIVIGVIIWCSIGISFAALSFKKDLNLEMILTGMFLGPIAVFPWLDGLEIERRLQQEIAEIEAKYRKEKDS